MEDHFKNYPNAVFKIKVYSEWPLTVPAVV